METAEVQQEAAALSSQFRTLAQDFRGIDPAGGHQRVVDLAAFGAKLCKKAYDAGLLDLTPYKRQVALLTEQASKNTCQQDDFRLHHPTDGWFPILRRKPMLTHEF